MSRKSNAAVRIPEDAEPAAPNDQRALPRHPTATVSTAEQRRRTNRFLMLFLGIPFSVLTLMILHQACS